MVEVARARLAIALTVVAAACGGVTLTACGGTGQLLGKHSGKKATSAYLASLTAAQARLAAAEKRIPARPRTPVALSRAIGLLAVAVRRLGDDLSSIHPPPSVAADHARLVAIVRGYATSLARTARTAASPGGEQAAARRLVTTTSGASQAFSSTVAKINTTLARET